MAITSNRPEPPAETVPLKEAVRAKLIAVKLKGDVSKDRDHDLQMIGIYWNQILDDFHKAKTTVNDKDLWRNAIIETAGTLGWAGYKDSELEALQVLRRLTEIYLRDCPANEDTKNYVMNDLLLSKMAPEDIQKAMNESPAASSTTPNGAAGRSFRERMGTLTTKLGIG